MKKTFPAFILVVLFALPAFSQQTGNENYAQLFCKIWGFLKYHHPAVAKGYLNWDSVFVTNITTLSASNSSADFNKQLKVFIKAAGDVTASKPNRADTNHFTLNAKDSISWIRQSSLLNTEIKSALTNIYHNRNQGPNKYIAVKHNTADYSGEAKYEDIGFPRQEYRLLFLSRFWNIINYYAPYKYLVEGGWDNVLSRFIPRMQQANDSLSYYKAMLELAKSLQDGHSGFSKSMQVAEIFDLVYGKYTAPFYCEIINDSAVVRGFANDSICQAAGLKAGDVILKADNRSIATLLTETRKYISASNKLSETHMASWHIFDGQSPRVRLTVMRGKNVVEMDIARIPTSKINWGGLINYKHNDKGYEMLDDGTLLIYAAQISNKNLDTIKSFISKAKNVIFDVRNYPANDAFYMILDPFLKQPSVINYITEPIANMPGTFAWIQSPKIGQVNNNAFKGKVVILADERSQSQGEYSCMVLQTIPGAVTIGRQTAGADGLVTYIPMGSKMTLSYSGYGVYYPDKKQTQQTGISIDITVPKTIAAVQANTDETLERAIKYLKEGK